MRKPPYSEATSWLLFTVRSGQIWGSTYGSARWDATRKFVDQFDLLLTPTVPVPPLAVRLGAPEGNPDTVGALPPFPEWLPFTYPWNTTGQPAATVPRGFTHEGLLLGLQAVPRRFADAIVLRAAATFEHTHS